MAACAGGARAQDRAGSAVHLAFRLRSVDRGVVLELNPPRRQPVGPSPPTIPDADGGAADDQREQDTADDAAYRHNRDRGLVVRLVGLDGVAGRIGNEQRRSHDWAGRRSG